MTEDYNFKKIEKKWQDKWEKEEVFKSCEDPQKSKYYCLEMYPYPSGHIHMGQIRNYAIGDVISRFQIMKGFNVIHPIGWDALGMPAENAAITQGIHPQEWTLGNISHMKKQLKRLGFSYDWSREVNTCLPEYYKWNQWIFLKMLEKDLAYRKKSWVNWCPQCKTVLANEQVVGERCWRCESLVKQKEMKQWFLKITDYAEELLSGHELLEKWPEHVLLMQKNWIGKSTGGHITFPLSDSSQSIEVFTTRVDTIYGATFLVLSPEHPLSQELIADSDQKEKAQEWIERNISESRVRKDLEEVEKEGIDTGKKAINPYTNEEIPIWIANYVLMEYGTGAIMAVPAHDQRDFDFAKKYSLQIKVVIVTEGKSPELEPEEAFEDYGVVVNSGQFSGKPCHEAIEEMVQYAEEKGFGRKSTLYRLRDWGISRQRYWGTPIPVIYCKNCGIAGVPYEDLPVLLPYDVEFEGKEGSPLENVESFVKTTCPKCHEEARRETDTMDTFFDSSWYHYRYTSPHEEKLPFNSKAADYWLPVDLYIGGVEHAILHLIYARFFCKFLRDFGLSVVNEPFPRLLAQGMVTKDGAKMSKSKGNVVDPDGIVEKYGADTLRLFILFASPPEKEFAWNDEGIEGCYKFLNRVWLVLQENLDLYKDKSSNKVKRKEEEKPTSLIIKMHQTIKKVSEDIEKRYHLNTAISSLMEYYNQIKKEKDELRKSEKGKEVLKESLENLVILLSPFAPHLCEEFWERMGQESFILRSPWPSFDPSLAKEEKVTVVVQVNGKLRDKFEAERDLDGDLIKEMALGLSRIRNIVGEKKVKKIIYVRNKLINIVL
ncbi:MAG: leucine--tRNA ligase [Candidatus Aminicenantes bacterium]|nr:leucine--tRNA ligase [Candidatus Aminicenantes bacterium]MBL7082801.1 leucine--tRNA ligase [Candidatus Aminicenantes bacterium]